MAKLKYITKLNKSKKNEREDAVFHISTLLLFLLFLGAIGSGIEALKEKFPCHHWHPEITRECMKQLSE